MQHNDLGKLGEDLATTYLQQKNYVILARNWRSGKAEIDIIAQIEKNIIFIEVKTRKTLYFGFPEQAVNKHKQQLIANAAINYLNQINSENNKFKPQFDVIALVIQQKKIIQLHHIEHAFIWYDT